MLSWLEPLRENEARLCMLTTKFGQAALPLPILIVNIHRWQPAETPRLQSGEEAGVPFGLAGDGAERSPPGSAAKRYS